MIKTRLIPVLIMFLSLFSPVFSAVKQVRVIIDRAGIYIEPSRSSSRIEVVEKGTVLNLFQQKKVKDVWYYVSFNSRRYGSRVSGFIHESSVAPVEDAAAITPKVEEKKPPEKKQPAPVPEKPAPRAVPEKPQPAPPKAEPKQEVKLEPKPVVKYEEIVVLTSHPQPKNIKLPRIRPDRKELAWIPPQTAKPKEESKVVLADKKEILIEAAETAPSKPVETPPEAKKEQPPPVQPPPKVEAPVEKKAEKPPQKAARTAQPKQTETVPQTQKETASLAQPEAKKEAPVEKEAAKIPAAPARPSRYVSPGRRLGLITFGLGYGASFGGAGACLQLNTRSGFALHAGAGLYPTSLIYSETEWVENKTLFSVGLKYYLPFSSASLSPYVDVQYGGLRVEAAQLVIGIWEYSYVYGQEQKALYGPSFLAGTEIRLGRFGINGALGFSYCLTEWEYLEKKVSLAFDASLIVYF